MTVARTAAHVMVFRPRMSLMSLVGAENCWKCCCSRIELCSIFANVNACGGAGSVASTYTRECNRMSVDLDLDRWETEPQTALRTGMTERTLREWRRTGRGPAYVRVGGPMGRCRYRVRDVIEFMEQRTYLNTTDEANRARGI